MHAEVRDRGGGGGVNKTGTWRLYRQSAFCSQHIEPRLITAFKRYIEGFRDEYPEYPRNTEENQLLF